jgi:hypothetical protein
VIGNRKFKGKEMEGRREVGGKRKGWVGRKEERK